MRREGNARVTGSFIRRLWLGSLFVLVVIGGCRPTIDEVSLTPAEKSLTYIALAYGDAHSELGRGPKDADELKPFLKVFGDPDALLVSPNDGQPYVIGWGVDPTRGGPTDYMQMFPILAYEQSGGKRAITDIRGRPMTVPAEDMPKLTFVGRHRPS
jgi:hypothetical protein